ncbi:hypothetical protein HA466_0161410 [Hirschfeldia incana]|nr:hypothetical protein HA466_0161410 [Hirschfeldia incana]
MLQPLTGMPRASFEDSLRPHGRFYLTAGLLPSHQLQPLSQFSSLSSFSSSSRGSCIQAQRSQPPLPNKKSLYAAESLVRFRVN